MQEARMRHVKYLVCVLLCASGCLRPLQTDSRITLTTPITANVMAELQPKSSVHPIVEMPVDGREPGPGGAKVALVDVDGLLLNQNATGPYASGENPVDLFREKL